MKKPIKVHEQYRSRVRQSHKQHKICNALGWGAAIAMGVAYTLAGGHPLMSLVIGTAAGIWVYSLARLAAENITRRD